MASEREYPPRPGASDTTPSTRADTTGRGRRRTEEKRRAIVAAAERVFVRDGFAGASVDAIAAEAGVSKATLYVYFGDKQHLFRSILRAILESRVEAFASEGEMVGGAEGGAIEEELLALGRRWARAILQPDVLALRRLVIGEMERFPELGQVWFEAGPGRVDGERARQFARFAEEGRLQISDPELAAQHFGNLVVGPPQTMLLFKARGRLTEEEIDGYVRAGVAVFLSHYGPRAGE